jgi:hypothetical protein
MISFFHMSIKYHGLKYFVSKHMLADWCKKYHDYVMTFKYRSIQILWYSNTLLANRLLASDFFSHNYKEWLNYRNTFLPVTLISKHRMAKL